MVNIQSRQVKMNDPGFRSLGPGGGAADRSGKLSPHMSLPGPLVSSAGSPGTAISSGPLGGSSPASGSNLVVGAGVTNQRRFDEDVNLALIKVVVLGAPAVGKTSVVRVSESAMQAQYAETNLKSSCNITELGKVRLGLL